jgi:GNAT superfamily N-acetyltransferase
VSTPIQVAPCPQAELQQLYRLAEAAFCAYRGWDGGRVRRVLDRDRVFVAQEAGLAAGYLALHDEGSRVIVVDQLLVAFGHEGHGVGRRLLSYAEEYALSEGAHSLQIAVEEDNGPARRFYERSGLEPVGPELLELRLPRRAGSGDEGAR